MTRNIILTASFIGCLAACILIAVPAMFAGQVVVDNFNEVPFDVGPRNTNESFFIDTPGSGNIAGRRHVTGNGGGVRNALAMLGEAANASDIVWRVALCGIGYGIFQAPNNREMIGSVALEYSANASGVLASVRTFGQALGTAMVGMMLALSAGSLSLALWVCCACVVVALMLSLWRVPLARNGRAA